MQRESDTSALDADAAGAPSAKVQGRGGVAQATDALTLPHQPHAGQMSPLSPATVSLSVPALRSIDLPQQRLPSPIPDTKATVAQHKLPGAAVAVVLWPRGFSQREQVFEAVHASARLHVVTVKLLR